MAVSQKFGGKWTEEKLDKLTQYLNSYLTLFSGNPVASKFVRHYVDAFAGSGIRVVAEESKAPLLQEVKDTVSYMEGSVHRVLQLEKDFHHYHFVEKNAAYADQLRRTIKERYPDREPRCNVINGDANDFILRWCRELKWSDRGVVFLDPYGMAVEWETIKQLAATKKVDLWMLFPCSSVIRMLPNSGPPDEDWSRRLTTFFGTDSWKDEFYRPSMQGDMFNPERLERVVTVERVASYFLRRLRQIFAGVTDHPIPLYNSRGSLIFLLVFAVANERGKKPALEIASYIGQN